MNNKTLAFYNKNAKAFAEETAFVDFKETQDKFINILQGKRVLDFGCGAGRDSKYFVEAGLDVVAIDGSAELCQIAESYVGIPVQQMLFQELDDRSRYDGIWACSSILHLPKEELRSVLMKMLNALTDNGIIYTSFKTCLIQLLSKYNLVHSLQIWKCEFLMHKIKCNITILCLIP